MLVQALKLAFTFMLLLGNLPQLDASNYDCHEIHKIVMQSNESDIDFNSNNENSNTESDQHKNCPEHAGNCHHNALIFLGMNNSENHLISFSLINETRISHAGKISNISDGPFRPPRT